MKRVTSSYKQLDNKTQQAITFIVSSMLCLDPLTLPHSISPVDWDMDGCSQEHMMILSTSRNGGVRHLRISADSHNPLLASDNAST